MDTEQNEDMWETCHTCYRVQRLAWSVTDEAWNQVVPADLRHKTLCMECFLAFARRAGVTLRREHLRFLALTEHFIVVEDV